MSHGHILHFSHLFFSLYRMWSQWKIYGSVYFGLFTVILNLVRVGDWRIVAHLILTFRYLFLLGCLLFFFRCVCCLLRASTSLVIFKAVAAFSWFYLVEYELQNRLITQLVCILTAFFLVIVYPNDHLQCILFLYDRKNWKIFGRILVSRWRRRRRHSEDHLVFALYL